MNLENQPYLISHAQNREDIILSGFFKTLDTGFYVDVGANDPNLDSVTKFFYEKGWSGINVEPIPKLYARLQAARPRDINLNMGVSNANSSMTFREYPALHGLSTFAKNIQDDYDKLALKDKKYKEFKEYAVPVKTLADIFKEHHVKIINFMKVDVEGYEYEVLEGNDWKKYRPQVICIESNHMTKDWRPILLEHGYEQIFFDGLNSYYIAKEAESPRDSFSYIQTMLPTPVIDYRVVGILEYYKNTRLEAETRNAELSNRLHVAQHNLYVTQQELDRAKSIRGAIKTLARKGNNIIEEVIIPSRYRGIVAPKVQNNSEVETIEGAAPEEIFKAIRKYDTLALRSLNPSLHKFRFWLLYTYRRYVLGTLRRMAKVGFKVLKTMLHKGK